MSNASILQHYARHAESISVSITTRRKLFQWAVQYSLYSHKAFISPSGLHGKGSINKRYVLLVRRICFSQAPNPKTTNASRLKLHVHVIINIGTLYDKRAICNAVKQPLTFLVQNREQIWWSRLFSETFSPSQEAWKWRYCNGWQYSQYIRWGWAVFGSWEPDFTKSVSPLSVSRRRFRSGSTRGSVSSLQLFVWRRLVSLEPCGI